MAVLIKIGSCFKPHSIKSTYNYFLLMILFSLVVFPIIPTISPQSNTMNSTTIQSSAKISSVNLTQSEPISIQDNNQFLLYAKQNSWSGSGTQQSPIIIENLLIQDYNLSQPFCGFCVENTNLYFIFRDNVINTSSVANQLNQYSIGILYSENGQIYNNNITSSNSLGIGLYMYNSANTVVTNNIINGFYFSSLIYNSNATFTNNLFQNNYYGTFLNDSIAFNPQTTIYQYYSILFQNNFYFNNNFAVKMTGTEFFHLHYNIRIENNIFIQNPNGLSISSYSVNVTNNYFANNSNYALTLMRALYSNVSNNYFDHNGIGIDLINPNYSTVFTQNNCIINSYIPECSESQNTTALQLHVSNVSISDNIITNQTTAGLSIASHADQNFIVGNNFINNSIQAEQQSSNNWNNNTMGNYWSNYNGKDQNNDGIGDTPYVIQQGGSDSKPLMKELVIPINNSALPQVIYRPRDLVQSAFFYSIFVIPLLAILVVSVIAIAIWRYKKYINSMPKTRKKVSFQKYVKKQTKILTTRPKKKREELNANKALEILEEIMDETGSERPI